MGIGSLRRHYPAVEVKPEPQPEVAAPVVEEPKVVEVVKRGGFKSFKQIEEGERLELEKLIE